MRYGPMGGSAMLVGFGGFVFTLLVIGLVTALVIYLSKRNKQGPEPRPHHATRTMPPAMPPAMQVLDERLARGEIEIADYLERRAALLGQHPGATEWPPVPPQQSERPTDQPAG